MSIFFYTKGLALVYSHANFFSICTHKFNKKIDFFLFPQKSKLKA